MISAPEAFYFSLPLFSRLYLRFLFYLFGLVVYVSGSPSAASVELSFPSSCFLFFPFISLQFCHNHFLRRHQKCVNMKQKGYISNQYMFLCWSFSTSHAGKYLPCSYPFIGSRKRFSINSFATSFG